MLAVVYLTLLIYPFGGGFNAIAIESNYRCWLRFDMQPRFPVFRLRPFALLVYRQLIDHRLGNLIISDASPALSVPQQELHISPF